TAARMTFEPGWKWSDCVKPVAGTDTCQLRHIGVVGSGRLTVRHDDGTEVELGAGDAYVIEPGHDAWVVGDEPFVGYEFESRAASYAATTSGSSSRSTKAPASSPSTLASAERSVSGSSRVPVVVNCAS